MTSAAAIAAAQQTLAAGSKSFALAARLLGRRDAERAAVLYAWCRRADDAVDLCAPADAPRAVAALRRELADAYAARLPADAEPILGAFAAVVHELAIPEAYPAALLDGMAADATGRRYATLADLLRYGFEVAGTVGLMMSHVFGVRDERALRRAVHLGIAMQLTNICRDVAEDWERGRLYLPDDLCAAHGAPGLRARLGEPVSALPRAAIAGVVTQLLAIADDYYASGGRGIRALPWRAALAVRTARAVYARIGRQLAARGGDALAGRTIVPGSRKLVLALASMVRQLVVAPVALFAARCRTPTLTLRFPDDVLPL